MKHFMPESILMVKIHPKYTKSHKIKQEIMNFLFDHMNLNMFSRRFRKSQSQYETLAPNFKNSMISIFFSWRLYDSFDSPMMLRYPCPEQLCAPAAAAPLPGRIAIQSRRRGHRQSPQRLLKSEIIRKSNRQ